MPDHGDPTYYFMKGLLEERIRQLKALINEEGDSPLRTVVLAENESHLAQMEKVHHRYNRV